MEDEPLNRLSLPVFKELVKNSARLTAIVWKDKKWQIILLAIIFLVVSAETFLQSGSRGLLINELINIGGGGLIGSRLFLLVGLLILAGFIPSILYAVQRYLSLTFWYYLEEKFELELLKRQAEIDVAVHEDPAQKDLFNKVKENGTWRMRSFLDRQFWLLQNVVEVVLAAAVILFSEWWVFFLILVGTLPELITEVRYGRRVWGIHSGRAEIRRRYWDLQDHFHRLPSIVELKLFQNIPYFLKTIRELFVSFQTEQKINERKKLWRQLASLALSQVTIAVAIVVFVWGVVRGDLLVGTFTFVIASITSLRQSLSGLFANLGVQYQDSLFVTDIFRLLDTKPAVVLSKNGVTIDAAKTLEIIFDRVSFAYPGTKKLVLKDLSFQIVAGEKLALVGINGAGKTTLVKLLCRFYDPTAGRILINGIDLKEIDLESWYAQLGIIFQDYAQYHFLVKEAIAVGRMSQGTLVEKVKRAAKASEADAFIEEWEKNYDQMLGKEFTGGVEPSIGQWQKLALARTFYRDPKILILDEPTSSIDAAAEAKIFEKLELLPSDRTVILISHRFSTVRRAQKIAVIDKGELTELGTHEDLLKLGGTYANLFLLQARGYR